MRLIAGNGSGGAALVPGCRDFLEEEVFLEDLPRLRYYTELTEESVIDVFAMDQWQTGSIAAIRFELRGSKGKGEYLQLWRYSGQPRYDGSASAKVTAGQSVQ